MIFIFFYHPGIKIKPEHSSGLIRDIFKNSLSSLGGPSAGSQQDMCWWSAHHLVHDESMMSSPEKKSRYTTITPSEMFCFFSIISSEASATIFCVSCDDTSTSRMCCWPSSTYASIRAPWLASSSTQTAWISQSQNKHFMQSFSSEPQPEGYFYIFSDLHHVDRWLIIVWPTLYIYFTKTESRGRPVS